MNCFYYAEDGTSFTSKIQAVLYGDQHKQRIGFDYFDKEWNKVDWKIQPVGSLDYHYRMQAQRIRDEYDYVILCYSGGYDSTNILETFYYNNIKLDKIVCVGAFSQDSASMVDENHNGELYHNCFPYINELGLSSIVQKCDYSNLFSDPKNFSVYELGEEWVDHISGFYSPHNWFWRDLEKHVVPSGLENKRVAILFGKDKPYIFLRNNNPEFAFMDSQCFGYAHNYNKISNVERINFYWDPAYPYILIKQLHVLLNLPMVLRTQTDRMIYNLRKPLIFKSPKSPTNLLSLRDKFLLNHMNSSLFDFYKHGIRNMNKRIGIKPKHQITTKFYRLT
jgi:hypothetical protein